MPESLASAAKKRQAKKTAQKTTKSTRKTKTATKTATKTEEKKNLATTTPSNTTPAKSNNGTVVSRPNGDLPGLTQISPDSISSELPKFDPNQYQISDPLHPSESLPQVSENEYEKGMSIYQGSIRALKLTGAAMDVTRERYGVESKKAKAFSAGVKAATDFEKVAADYTDYRIQLETNSQKSDNYSLAQTRTTINREINEHSETELNEKLDQARIGADIAKEETKSKQTKLDELINRLGNK